MLSLNIRLGLLDLFDIRHDARTIEQLGNFLQTVALGLGKQGEGDGQEDGEQAAVDDVVAPANVVHADGVDKGHDDERAVDAQQLARDALGPQAVGEQLGWVGPGDERSQRVGFLAGRQDLLGKGTATHINRGVYAMS